MKPVSRRKFISILAGAGGAAVVGGVGIFHLLSGNRPRTVNNTSTGTNVRGLQAAYRTTAAFGAEVTLTVLAERFEQADRAAGEATAELQRIERVMSIFRPDSQLSRLNRDAVLSDPDPLLVETLLNASELSQRSAGAFDVTVQPIWSAYALADRESRLPGESELASARALVGWQGVEVSRSRIRLARAGMALTLNGLAQGLAADRVVSVLRENGIEHALINTGEVASLGRGQAGRPWVSGIQHPRVPEAYMATMKLDGRCVATSGDYETRFGQGFENHHIFDPATGRSPGELASLTVLAPRAVDADGLSTAAFVLGGSRGLELLAGYKNVDALMVFKDGRTLATSGFPTTG